MRFVLAVALSRLKESTLEDKKIKETTIALAGLAQSIGLIREIAQKGKADPNFFETSIQSIFETDPENVLAVYGNIPSLQLGLEKLTGILHPNTDHARLNARYMLSMMRLQRKVARNPRVLNTLGDRIQQTKKQVEYFSLTHPTVIANLADIYINIITPFRFRFFVLGNQKILSIHENMEKIRALLLAALRSAVLWRQLGGSRLQLLFSRAKIRACASQLLKDIATNEGKVL
jgi:high frequency lysogenization protein